MTPFALGIRYILFVELDAGLAVRETGGRSGARRDPAPQAHMSIGRSAWFTCPPKALLNFPTVKGATSQSRISRDTRMRSNFPTVSEDGDRRDMACPFFASTRSLREK